MNKLAIGLAFATLMIGPAQVIWAIIFGRKKANWIIWSLISAISITSLSVLWWLWLYEPFQDILPTVIGSALGILSGLIWAKRSPMGVRLSSGGVIINETPWDQFINDPMTKKIIEMISLVKHPITISIMVGLSLGFLSWWYRVGGERLNILITLAPLLICLFDRTPPGKALFDFLLVRHVPWHIKYQGKHIRKTKPMEFPWIHPHPEIKKLKVGVAIVSWVPHWSGTFFSGRLILLSVLAVGLIGSNRAGWLALFPIFALGLISLLTIFVSKLIGRFHEEMGDRIDSFARYPLYAILYIFIGTIIPMQWSFQIAIIIILLTMTMMEWSRWNEIYTLVDNQCIMVLERGIFNWRIDPGVYVNLSQAMELRKNDTVLHSLFGCLKEVTILARGGGPIRTLELIPWQDSLYQAIEFAASPKTGASISLAYVLGLHWLDWLERVTKFQNKLGDLFLGANIGWDWMDPSLRVKGTAEYEVDSEWPTRQRANREKRDLHMSPEKGFYLTHGIHEAWKAGEQASTPQKQWKLGCLKLREMADRKDNYKPALHAWNNKALSPLSTDWKDFYVPSLTEVMKRWGSFSTPGKGTNQATGAYEEM